MNIKFKEFVDGFSYDHNNFTKTPVTAAEYATFWLKENSVKIIDWKAFSIEGDKTVIIIQYCELDKQDEVQSNE